MILEQESLRGFGGMDFKAEFAKKYGIEQEMEDEHVDDEAEDNEDMSSYGEEDDDQDNEGGLGRKDSHLRRSNQAFLNGSISYEMPQGSRTNYKGHWTKEEVSNDLSELACLFIQAL